MSSDSNSVSIKGAATDAVIISGRGNQVTVYLATGIARSANVGEPTRLGSDLGPNPYRGLAAFLEEDADRFFGRSKQIARLWEAFRELHEPAPGAVLRRILPILGPSGSGKSSLARAGLVPEIARHAQPTLEAPRVVVLTPTAHPLEALARILARVVFNDMAPIAKAAEFEAELRHSTDGRYEGLRRLAKYVPEIDRRKLVVLVDQFEETYTLCSNAEEQDAFVANLLHATQDADCDVSMILTLRTDFIGSTQRQVDLNRIITEQGLIVPAMDADELREAISRPAANAGHPFDPALVELLVQQTVGREGALPLLQFALQRLWEATREGKDPTETLQQIGGVGGALAQEADQLYESMSERQKRIARRAFRSMVQLGENVADTRRWVDLNSITAKDESPDEVLGVLRAFAQPSKRLVTLEGDSGDVIAEVTHEALIRQWEKLRKWLGPEQREDERFRRRFAEATVDWDTNSRRPDLLWRGFALGRLREFAKRTDDDLTLLEQSFLQASSREEISTKRRQIWRTASVWCATVVALALIGYLGYFEYLSRQQKEFAKRNFELAINSAQQLLNKVGDSLNRGNMTVMGAKNMLSVAAEIVDQVIIVKTEQAVSLFAKFYLTASDINATLKDDRHAYESARKPEYW